MRNLFVFHLNLNFFFISAVLLLRGFNLILSNFEFNTKFIITKRQGTASYQSVHIDKLNLKI